MITIGGSMRRDPPYGFRATLAENKAELDRFIAAMTRIRAEIRHIETGQWPADNNPLKHAPHTQQHIAAADCPHPYSREEAVFPRPWGAENKFWPKVNRIDDVYGDRNLVCGLPD
jgi:glycine dehydrogenase